MQIRLNSSNRNKFEFWKYFKMFWSKMMCMVECLDCLSEPLVVWVPTINSKSKNIDLSFFISHYGFKPTLLSFWSSIKPSSLPQLHPLRGPSPPLLGPIHTHHPPLSTLMAHNPRRPNYITTLPILQTTLYPFTAPIFIAAAWHPRLVQPLMDGPSNQHHISHHDFPFAQWH